MIPSELFAKALRSLFAPIASYLDDPSVSEIMINGPKAVFVERKGTVERTPAVFDSDEAILAGLRNVAQFAGGSVEAEQPILEARLPDGSRLRAVIAPIARDGPAVSIRRPSRARLTLEQLVDLQSLTAEAADALLTLIRARCNLVIAGGPGSGKTSLLGVLVEAVPASERLFILEDSREIEVAREHVVYLAGRAREDHGELQVSIQDLVRTALGMRPDRIVVGEVSGAESLDLAQAALGGVDGCLSTVRAGSPRDAMRRLELLCMRGDPAAPPAAAIRAQLAAGIDAVVQVARQPDGRRCVTHIVEVAGLDAASGEVELRALFERAKQGPGPSGGSPGPLLPTGAAPQLLSKLQAEGLSPAGTRVAAERDGER